MAITFGRINVAGLDPEFPGITFCSGNTEGPSFRIEGCESYAIIRDFKTFRNLLQNATGGQKGSMPCTEGMYSDDKSVLKAFPADDGGISLAGWGKEWNRLAVNEESPRAWLTPEETERLIELLDRVISEEDGEKVQIINLTPHALNLYTAAEVMKIQPEPTPARVTLAPDTPDGTIAGIPVYVTASTGAVTGLEKPKEGTVYVVSRQVYDACPDRDDLVITHQPVRGEGGQIIGCRALARPTR